MNEEKKGLKIAKSVIRFVVGSLVDLFVGAATSMVVDHASGPKIAKVGAKAGGFLVGMMVGDRVSSYICDSIDETVGEIDKLREAIDEEE